MNFSTAFGEPKNEYKEEMKKLKAEKEAKKRMRQLGPGAPYTATNRLTVHVIRSKNAIQPMRMSSLDADSVDIEAHTERDSFGNKLNYFQVEALNQSAARHTRTVFTIQEPIIDSSDAELSSFGSRVDLTGE